MNISNILSPPKAGRYILSAAEFVCLSRSRHILALIVILNVILLCLRAPDAVRQPQFWAEDGEIFFTEAHTLGLASIINPFAGYLHIAPRLVALLCNVFSAVEAPTLYLIFSIVVIAWVTLTIATCSTRLSKIFALVILLCPGCGELYGTLTNVQWFMQLAMLLALTTSTPRSSFLRYNQFLFVTISSVTGPFSIFMSPIALAEISRKNTDIQKRSMCLIIMVGAIVQLCFIINHTGHQNLEPARATYVFRLIAGRWFHQLATGGLNFTFYTRFCTAIVLVASLICLRTGDRLFKYLYIYSIVLLTVTWVRYLHDGDALKYLSFAERYFYGPRVVVLWCILDSLFRFQKRSGLAAIALAIICFNFNGWVRQPLSIYPWRSEAWKIDRGDAVNIVINPSKPGDAEPYAVILPAVP